MKNGFRNKEKKVFIAGLLLIVSGLTFNEWSLAALFSEDGIIAPNHKVVIWFFDLFLISIGLILLALRKSHNREKLLVISGAMLILFGIIFNAQYLSVLLGIEIKRAGKVILQLIDYSAIIAGVILILYRYRTSHLWSPLSLVDTFDEKHHVAIICGIGIIAASPLLIFGFPNTHSSVLNLSYLIGFSEQFWSGDFYPRWIMRLNDGLGSPVFFYYGPVAFYLSSLIDLIIPGDPLKWHTLGVSSAFILVLSGISSYLWLRCLTNPQAAFIGAIVFMILPYHYEIDLIKRGSFCEYTAYIWMPLVLLCISKIAQERRIYIAHLSFSYALLIGTYAPTTLLFSPFALLYSMLISWDKRNSKIFFYTLTGFLGGVGLSSIYLLPAMLTQQYIHSESWWEGFFKYSNWFFFQRNTWPDHEAVIHFMMRLQNVMILIAIMSSLLFFSVFRYMGRWGRRHIYFWLLVIGICFILMTKISLPIWDHTPFLKKVQFPFRLMTVIDLSFSAILALWFAYYMKYRGAFRLKVMEFSVAILIGFFLLSGIWEVRGNILPAQNERSFVSTVVGHGIDAPEYRPQWVRSDIKIGNCIVKKYIEQQGDKEFSSECRYSSERVQIVEGSGTAVANRWEAREIHLQTNSPGRMKLLIRQFYFPAWSARINGQMSDLVVEPTADIGLIKVSVPGGRHKIRLKLKKLKEEKLGTWISGMLLFGIVAFFIYEIRMKKAGKTHNI